MPAYPLEGSAFAPTWAYNPRAKHNGVRPHYVLGPNTGSGRTLTVPEPKTKDFMHLLVQLTKGTA
jgi:hypothetical protein